MQVCNLEGPLSKFHGNYFDDNSTVNTKMVFVDIMAKLLLCSPLPLPEQEQQDTIVVSSLQLAARQGADNVTGV